MHVPAEYRAPSAAAVADLLDRNPFALLVGVSGEGPDAAPVATHVPVVRPADAGPAVRVGDVLWGHLATVNPQWREFTGHPRGLLVFSGASGYVSPTTYRVEPAAPTWNYAAVHVTARIEVLPAGEETLSVILETVRALERRQNSPWDVTPSMDYVRRILPGVIAFAAHVEDVRAEFKMSQDKPPEVRERVRERFAADGRDDLVEAMDQAAP
ncbi:FMN-binding negative transcriptional regulator [Kineococcus sp. GCM10028916]|uniref:FMN-binding negative transcriptional regulator n=1 Tax=Kineococcus sp. GCM10028916 TaxID=3273394 RepID=UPI0036397E3A